MCIFVSKFSCDELRNLSVKSSEDWMPVCINHAGFDLSGGLYICGAAGFKSSLCGSIFYFHPRSMPAVLHPQSQLLFARVSGF